MLSLLRYVGMTGFATWKMANFND